jgi:hypothetical protein
MSTLPWTAAASTALPRCCGRTFESMIPCLYRFIGSELKSELAAHHSGEEPSDRVRLPARHRHDGLKGRALGAPKHGDDPRLLGASAGAGSRTSGGLHSGPPVPGSCANPEFPVSAEHP